MPPRLSKPFGLFDRTIASLAAALFIAVAVFLVFVAGTR